MPELEEIKETPEDVELEKEALKDGVTEEDITKKLVEDLDLDPDIDADLLDKLTKKEMAQRKNFSKVVRQKRDWREKAKTPPKDAKETPKQGDTPNPDDKKYLTPEELDQKLNERLEARDLDELTLPDEIKDEIKKIAKAQGISIKAAAKDPYITYKKDEWEKEKKVEENTPARKNKGKYNAEFDTSKGLDIDKYDLNTDEGVKAWRADKAKMDAHRAKSS